MEINELFLFVVIFEFVLKKKRIQIYKAIKDFLMKIRNNMSVEANP